MTWCMRPYLRGMSGYTDKLICVCFPPCASNRDKQQRQDGGLIQTHRQSTGNVTIQDNEGAVIHGSSGRRRPIVDHRVNEGDCVYAIRQEKRWRLGVCLTFQTT